MQIIVDGVEARLEYLLFTEGTGGAILQIMMAVPPPDRNPELHSALVDEFKAHFQGVMDKAEIVEGCTEIRLLHVTMLECIDIMRMSGHGVVESLPNA
jgi:hypothetical protein